MSARRRQRWGVVSERFLAADTEVRVRFQEVDSLRVVWHGHYLSYLECGRTAFGQVYGFRYQDILAAGFLAPIVHVSLDYFAPAHFDEQLRIHTRMHLDPGARIHFRYRIETAASGDVSPRKLATASSVQVFTEPDGTLLLTRPAFFEAFIARWHDQARSEG